MKLDTVGPVIEDVIWMGILIYTIHYGEKHRKKMQMVLLFKLMYTLQSRVS